MLGKPEGFDKVYVDTRREVKITEAVIDAETLMTMELKEGVDVRDYSHDPPLFYKHKNEISAEEWAKIVADAHARPKCCGT